MASDTLNSLERAVLTLAMIVALIVLSIAFQNSPNFQTVFTSMVGLTGAAMAWWFSQASSKP